MSTLLSSAQTSLTRLPRIADTAAARARLSVVPRRVLRAPRTPFVAMVVLLLGVGVAGLLAFNTNMQQGSFQISTLNAEATALQSHQQQLQMDLQLLRQPQHLADRAKRLGMVPPPAPAFLMLATGRVLGDPSPAVSTDAMRVNGPGPSKPAVLAPRPKIVTIVVPWAQWRAHLKQQKKMAHSGTRRTASGAQPTGSGTTVNTSH